MISGVISGVIKPSIRGLSRNTGGGVWSPWPLTRIVQVAALGDSQSALGNVDTENTKNRYQRGYLSWVESSLGWNYSSIKNYALGGSTLTDQLAFVNTDASSSAAAPYGVMSANAPDLVFALGGTNDQAGGTDVGTIVARKTATIAAMRAIGSDPHILNMGLWPRTSQSALNAARLLVNAAFRGMNNTRVRYYDSDATLQDPSNPANLLPAYDDDGTHLNTAGARAEALAVVASLSDPGLLPAPIVYPRTLDAADDATNIIRDFSSNNSQRQKLAGTLLTPTIGGTTNGVVGFKTGSQYPTGWSVTAYADWFNSAGDYVYCNVENDGTNLKKVVFTVPNGVAPATDAFAQVSISSSSTGISSARAAALGITGGKSFRAGCRVEISNAVNLTRVQLRLRMTIDGVQKNVYMFFPYDNPPLDGTDQLPTTLDMDLLSPEISVPPGASTVQIDNIQVVFGFKQGLTAGGTFKVSRTYVREHSYLASWP